MADIDTAAMREHYNAPANTGRATPDIEELCDEIDRLRARLAEAEAELASEAEAHRRSAAGRAAAEARLAEVEAVFGDRDCPNGYEVNEPGCDCYVCKVRAAAQGGGDRGA